MSRSPLSQSTDAIPVSPPVMVWEEDHSAPAENTFAESRRGAESRGVTSRRSEWLLDVFAMNSFSWAIAIPIEVVLAGMSWREHLKVRLLAVLFNTVIARPFSLYRNWIVGRFGQGGVLHNYAVDTFVFLSFQLPLYMSNMLLGGASAIEILTASGTFVLLAGAMGRPYGLYLDLLRRIWGKRRYKCDSLTGSTFDARGS